MDGLAEPGGAAGVDWTRRSGLTAILIALPELAGYTDRWRSVSYSPQRPDLPLTALIPPHVTVLVPWVTGPRPEHVQRLADAVADAKPFELWFGSVEQFPDGTVFLRPEPFDEVRMLIKMVIAAFPECQPYGGAFPDPHPHLTVSATGPASETVAAEAESALAADPPPSVLLDDLTIWRQGDSVWQLVGSVPVGPR